MNREQWNNYKMTNQHMREGAREGARERARREEETDCSRVMRLNGVGRERET